MPWLKKVRPVHRCPAPAPGRRIRSGSVWQCRRCAKVWVLDVERIDANGFPRRWRWNQEARP